MGVGIYDQITRLSSVKARNRPGLSKFVQQKSHWQKTKNTSELQNQFVVSNTVR